jgi:mycothiol system anti-sigma-R factor
MKERCRETLERAYMYIDGEVLSDEERLEIQAHLEDCAPCLQRVGLDREVARVLNRLRGSQRCPQEVKTRITALIFQSRTRYK